MPEKPLKAPPLPAGQDHRPEILSQATHSQFGHRGGWRMRSGFGRFSFLLGGSQCSFHGNLPQLNRVRGPPSEKLLVWRPNRMRGGVPPGRKVTGVGEAARRRAPAATTGSALSPSAACPVPRRSPAPLMRWCPRRNKSAWYLPWFPGLPTFLPEPPAGTDPRYRCPVESSPATRRDWKNA